MDRKIPLISLHEDCPHRELSVGAGNREVSPLTQHESDVAYPSSDCDPCLGTFFVLEAP
jgi:hypothetical protein